MARSILPINGVANPGTVLSTGAGAMGGSPWTPQVANGGTVGPSTVVPGKYNPGSMLYFTVPADAGAFAYVTKALGPNLNLSRANSIGVSVYIDSAQMTQTQAATISIYLFTSTPGTADFYLATVAMTRPGWNFIQIKKSAFSATGSPTWADINQLRLRVNGTTALAKTLYFDGLVAGLRGRPKICFTFDDAFIEQKTVAQSILLAAGIPATFFVMNGADGGGGVNASASYMTTADLNLLRADGHEIAYHGRHAPNNWADAPNPYPQIIGSIRSVNALGVTMAPLPVGAWPNGAYGHNAATDAASVDACVSAAKSAGLIACRAVLDAPFNPYSLAGSGEMLTVPGLSLNNTVTLSTALTRVDDAIYNGEIFVFTLHKLAGSADSITWVTSDFQALVDHAVAKRRMGELDITKFSDLMLLHGYSSSARARA